MHPKTTKNGVRNHPKSSPEPSGRLLGAAGRLSGTLDPRDDKFSKKFTPIFKNFGIFWGPENQCFQHRNSDFWGSKSVSKRKSIFEALGEGIFMIFHEVSGFQNM